MRSLILAAAITCAPMMVFAETYDCKIGLAGTGNWFGERIIFNYDGKSKTAMMDGDIARWATGGPMEVEVVTNNSKRLTMKWKVTGEKSVSGQVGANNYRWTIMKSDKSASGTMNTSGFDNSWSARAKCS